MWLCSKDLFDVHNTLGVISLLHAPTNRIRNGLRPRRGDAPLGSHQSASECWLPSGLSLLALAQHRVRLFHLEQVISVSTTVGAGTPDAPRFPGAMDGGPGPVRRNCRVGIGNPPVRTLQRVVRMAPFGACQQVGLDPVQGHDSHACPLRGRVLGAASRRAWRH